MRGVLEVSQPIVDFQHQLPEEEDIFSYGKNGFGDGPIVTLLLLGRRFTTGIFTFITHIIFLLECDYPELGTRLSDQEGYVPGEAVNLSLQTPTPSHLSGDGLSH